MYSERKDGDLEVIVRDHPDGVRTVTRSYGNYETWERYIVVPRDIVIRRLKEHNECLQKTSDPCVAAGRYLLPPSETIRPGQPWTGEPHLSHRTSRSFTFVQAGGWEV